MPEVRAWTTSSAIDLQAAFFSTLPAVIATFSSRVSSESTFSTSMSAMLIQGPCALPEEKTDEEGKVTILPLLDYRRCTLVPCRLKSSTMLGNAKDGDDTATRRHGPWYLMQYKLCLHQSCYLAAALGTTADAVISAAVSPTTTILQVRTLDVERGAEHGRVSDMLLYLTVLSAVLSAFRLRFADHTTLFIPSQDGPSSRLVQG